MTRGTHAGGWAGGRAGGWRTDGEVNGENVDRRGALWHEDGDEGRCGVREARVHGHPPRVLAPGARASQRVRLRGWPRVGSQASG